MSSSIYEMNNLFAWCVASHDVGKREPVARAAMLQSLGFKAQAWGNRMAGVRDLPKFHAEMAAMKQHGLTLTGRYVPTVVEPGDMRQIFDAIAQSDARPQIWVTGVGVSENASQAQRIAEQATVFEPWARMAAEYGLKVGLYNHAGWFGDPRNQIDIILALRDRGLSNVGIALCQHWSHAWLDDFEAVLERMQPHLLSISLSGMTRGADQTGQQFLPVGAGDEDVRLLGALERSGWKGPVGIINHTGHDASDRLADHLAGLEWVRARLRAESPSPPVWRTWAGSAG